MVEILQSGSVREEGIRHQHQHGEHVHDHQHPGGDQSHVHGWHSPPWACPGDDSFGLEHDAPTEPHLTAPEVMAYGDPDRLTVFMPYVPGMEHPEVVDMVLSQALNVIRQDVSTTQYDYWQLTRERWAAHRDWCYVEQDIVLTPGCIEELESCPEDWCFHDYTLQNGMSIWGNYGHGGAFGCVRFRHALTERHPDVIEDLFHRSWFTLDGGVITALMALGEKPHRHLPDVKHLHDYSTAATAARNG
jgi:hypothetical protein